MTHTEALKLARDCIRDSVEYKQGKATAIEAVEDIDEALAQPTSGDYALGYAEGFNDACKKPAQQEPVALEKQFSLLLWDYQELERAFEKVTGGKWIRKNNTPQRTWVGNGDLEDSNAYLTTPQRQWIGLTDEEVMEIAFNFDVPSLVIRTAEHKLKEKNT